MRYDKALDLSDDAWDLLGTLEEEGSLNLMQLQEMYEDKAAVVIALAELLQKGLVISLRIDTV
jgi:hypothetical protein